MTIPREFLKDYKDNYRRIGHDGAFQLLRSRITFSLRYGHAWFAKNRTKLEKLVAELEKQVDEGVSGSKA